MSNLHVQRPEYLTEDGERIEETAETWEHIACTAAHLPVLQLQELMIEGCRHQAHLLQAVQPAHLTELTLISCSDQADSPLLPLALGRLSCLRDLQLGKDEEYVELHSNIGTALARLPQLTRLSFCYSYGAGFYLPASA